MSISSEIVDGKGTSKVAHLHQKDEDVGLITYTHPLKVQEVKFIPALNNEYGIEMAVNGGFSGSAEEVHNGIDNTYWTGSNIIGAKVTFNSTDRPNNGTNSVKVDNPSANDIWQFDKGSDIPVSGSNAFTMAVNVDQDWNTGDSVGMYLWDTGLGSAVGNTVLLEDYFNETNFDVWQNIVVPMSDLGFSDVSVETIDSIRFEQLSKSAKAAKFYMDDLQLEANGAGSPIEFKVEAPIGYKFLVNSFNYTIIDAYDGRLADSSMPNLSYNKFLGEASLPNGLGFALQQNGESTFSSPIHNISDSLKGGASVINAITDGTNTSITIHTEFLEPTILDSRNDDKISITINDDLTGFISLTAIAMGKVEAV